MEYRDGTFHCNRLPRIAIARAKMANLALGSPLKRDARRDHSRRACNLSR
jgi:hypothetical protein